ncbi:hypothetical protein FACS1894172_16260 [Spirochaetia bacterium]|nr:hypothetical protein FACS1894172_16260 [Spirochaetia bacterium]
MYNMLFTEWNQERALEVRYREGIEKGIVTNIFIVAYIPKLKHWGFTPTMIKLDADVFEWFRSFGKGYQTRMNAALREYILSH